MIDVLVCVRVDSDFEYCSEGSVSSTLDYPHCTADSRSIHLW